MHPSYTRPNLSDDGELTTLSQPNLLQMLLQRPKPGASFQAVNTSAPCQLESHWNLLHGQSAALQNEHWHCLACCWLAGNRRLALIDRKQWEEVPQVMQLALCKVQFQDSIQQVLWCLTWREPNDFIDPLLKSFAQVWWYSQGPRERMHVHKVIVVACNWCTWFQAGFKMVVALYTGILFHCWVAILFPWRLFLVSQSMGWMKLSWWLLHLVARSDVIRKDSKNIQSRVIMPLRQQPDAQYFHTIHVCSHQATCSMHLKIGQRSRSVIQLSKPPKPCKTSRKVALLAWEKFYACAACTACYCQKDSRSCLALFLPKGSRQLQMFKLLPNTFTTEKRKCQGRGCAIGASLANLHLLKNLLAIVSCEQAPIAISACSAFLKGKKSRCGAVHTSVHTSLYRDRVGAFWQQSHGRSK